MKQRRRKVENTTPDLKSKERMKAWIKGKSEFNTGKFKKLR